MSITPGVYRIFSEDRTLLLEAPGSGGPVVMAASTGAPSQQWLIEPARDGSGGYIIRSRAYLNFLHTTTASIGALLVTKFAPFNWELQAKGGGRYFIKTHIVGEAAASKTGDSGSYVKLLAFQSSSAQTWVFEKV